MQNTEVESILLSMDLNEAPMTFKEDLLSLSDKRLPNALYDISDDALIDLWWWVKRNLQNWSTILKKPLNELPNPFCHIESVRDLVNIGNTKALSEMFDKYQFWSKKATLMNIYNYIKTYPGITLIGIHRSVSGFSIMLISHNSADGGADITQNVMSPLWDCITHDIVYTPSSRRFPIRVIDKEDAIRRFSLGVQ